MPSISQSTVHGGLDELLIQTLAAREAPVVRLTCAEIEMVWDDGESSDELAATHRFVRLSAPYERVEIEPVSGALGTVPRARPTTFVRTVAARAPITKPTVDKSWFDQSETSLAAIDEDSIDEPAPQATSWRWLGISVFVAAVAVLAQYAL